MGRVYRQTNVENLEHAFNVAERDLGVTRLLDPEGKTGPKAILTETPDFSVNTDNSLIQPFLCSFMQQYSTSN